MIKFSQSTFALTVISIFSIFFFSQCDDRNNENSLSPIAIIPLNNTIYISNEINGAVSIRMTPANASVNLDISSPDCNIILNQDEPERYFIQKIISSDNPNIPKGNGIYTIYIGDNHSEEVPEGKISFSLIEKGLIKHSTSAINIKKSDISSYVKSFGFKAAQNDFLSKDYYGSLHGDSLFITIPEYCDIRDLIPSFEINCEALLLDNKIIESETTSVNFKNKSLTFDIITFDGDKQSINVIVKTFTGLPTLFINTDNGEPVLTKENYIKAKMNIDGAGSFDDIDDIDLSIRCRGNSTFSYPKKPYALKLDDKISILGKPAHKRWVLLANWMDRPLLRNRISLKVAEKTGLAWTPGSEFVEVVLNGVHLGNYLLCEQIKIDKNRVNISSLKPSHISLPEISGGYLLELDSYFDEINKFRSDKRDLPVQIKDPDEDDLQPSQMDYIRDYFNKTEEIIFSENPQTNLLADDYIDMESFADWWFVYELVTNTEPNAPKSSYMHKDRNGKLIAGPVWDFDWGTFRSADQFMIKNSIWYEGLFKNPEFVEIVKSRWNTFYPGFTSILNEIEYERSYIRDSWIMNAALWPIENSDINGDEKMEFDDAIDRLKYNYNQRLTWLNKAINEL